MSRFISFDASLNFCSSSLFPIVWHHARTHACASTQRAEEGGRRKEEEEEEEEEMVVVERGEGRSKEQGARSQEQGGLQRHAVASACFRSGLDPTELVTNVVAQACSSELLHAHEHTHTHTHSLSLSRSVSFARAHSLSDSARALSF